MAQVSSRHLAAGARAATPLGGVAPPSAPVCADGAADGARLPRPLALPAPPALRLIVAGAGAFAAAFTDREEPNGAGTSMLAAAIVWRNFAAASTMEMASIAHVACSAQEAEHIL